MRYCITMEETKRVAVWFEAESDCEARERAFDIFSMALLTGFDGGDVERDFSLCDDEGRTLIDW